MAESVGFEPTVGYYPTPVFETGTLNRTQTTLQIFLLSDTY